LTIISAILYNQGGHKKARIRQGRILMADEIIFLVTESLEGGYEAKALGYPIFTQAETIEELKEAVKDATRCHFDQAEMPRIIRFHQVKEEVLSL